MYKREFFIYENVGQPPLQATNNHYQHSILLCRISDNQLDSVYPINYQESLAICQSVLYDLLYREVFGLDQELTDAVNLIRDQSKHKQTFMSNK
ncbi:N-acetylglucosaminyldiphosphodolichol N-acetylglucosaminyltransferase catalytic subunit alg13 [Mactra antiquata]